LLSCCCPPIIAEVLVALEMIRPLVENKNLLEIANVFAGLFTVILIGLFVENLIFRTIEQRTIRRWGMQH
jgi:ABC-type nitrate/sulfonate/bicarbonate transport system permease component